MDRIRRFVEQEIKGLHETAYLLGIFALLSAGFGFIRDRLLAGTFGASAQLDTYYAAFRIPDVVFVSLASLASVFVLVPVITKLTSEEEKQKLIGTVISIFSLIMMGVVVILWILTPYMTQLFFPEIAQKGPLLNTLTRILLIQPFLLGVSGILATVTQVYGRYFLYALTPLLYNGGIIIGIVFLYPLFGMVGIAFGVVLGALLHLGIQVPYARRIGYLAIKDLLSFDWATFKSVVYSSIPRTVSMAANNIALFVLVIIAGGLSAGSISVFTLAMNLQMAPLAIIGASYSVAAFPILAQFFARGEKESFCNHIVIATRHILFWATPLIVLSIVLRAHIVRVVLGSGAFNWNDTRLTAAALALFIVSLSAQALSLLFVRGYYAAGETIKPLLINITTALGTVFGAFGLVYIFNTNDVWKYFIETLLRVDDITGTGILMLPLSFTIFALINAGVFMYLFEKDFGVLWAHIKRVLFESFASAIVAGFFAYQFLVVLGQIFDINTFIGVFLIGLISGIGGSFVAWIVYVLLKSKEAIEVGKAFHHRIWRFVPVGGNGNTSDEETHE